jgi:hypothetical protein
MGLEPPWSVSSASGDRTPALPSRRPSAAHLTLRLLPARVYTKGTTDEGNWDANGVACGRGRACYGRGRAGNETSCWCAGPKRGAVGRDVRGRGARCGPGLCRPIGRALPEPGLPVLHGSRGLLCRDHRRSSAHAPAAHASVHPLPPRRARRVRPRGRPAPRRARFHVRRAAAASPARCACPEARRRAAGPQGRRVVGLSAA